MLCVNNLEMFVIIHYISDVNDVIVGSINQKLLEVERPIVLIKDDLARVR
jgi:hypothetical protein